MFHLNQALYCQVPPHRLCKPSTSVCLSAAPPVKLRSKDLLLDEMKNITDLGERRVIGRVKELAQDTYIHTHTSFHNEEEKTK